MTRIAFLSLLALTPAPAFSQSEGDDAGDALGTWSVEELCAARDNPEVWDELERRRLFRSRDLRSIKREEVIVGMSEEAMLCLKGRPQMIAPANANAVVNALYLNEMVRIEAYLYSAANGGDALAVFVGHGKEESAVVHVAEGDAEAVASEIASTVFGCSTSPRQCYIVDPAQGARVGPCGFPEFPGRIAGSAASSYGAGGRAVCGGN